jgi:tetratricopeptide (TPR) repeat protein
MNIRQLALAALVFAAGIGVGFAGQQKLDISLFQGKSNQEAARALLGVARAQASDGSWERIAIGRVYYLGGMKAEGQAIFDQVLAEKHKPSDELRIARIYREAGEWPKAKPLFDHYLVEVPKDATDTAEVGAYYVMNGDRAKAEELFTRSFGLKPELWATIAAAGGYLNVAPQE